ncbi:hypothetical protein [Planctobacterium marinum]|uniref:hypothetical protein n=1 Tax=Planctobacterium marinum TaxID=1631968 RepID=UPI001E318393|nr:hypothetical protein [Planctobacterium marinum]MCC2605111.1 hypothetical protein [Planctobacterium marinum]
MDFEFLTFVRVVNRLYSEPERESQKAQLIEWAKSVYIAEVFGPCKTSSGGDFSDVSHPDVCYQVMTLVTQRLANIEEPEDARHQFDAGVERKKRLQVLADLETLQQLIMGFYRSLDKQERLEKQAFSESKKAASDSMSLEHCSEKKESFLKTEPQGNYLNDF